MKYVVEIAGRSVTVELNGGAIMVDGRPVDARLAGRPGEVVRTLSRGRESEHFQAIPGESQSEWVLAAEGARLTALVLNARNQAIRKAQTAGGADKKAGLLKAPMPGMVVRVLVEEGAEVVAGQGLVVVEAMKMENELKAAGPGRVKKVLVTAGTRVEKGTALVDLV